jgi:hypothetical protein
VNETLDEFVAAGPAIQRPGLRALLTLARRPRGRALLTSLPLAQQAADSLVAMANYDEPARSRALGWDAEAIVQRGRELRTREQRP